MTPASPTLLTPEEAAAIARCSIKTVRRAYSSGALTAYRRRGSRAVLLDNKDVLAWVQGELLRSARPRTQATESVGNERYARPARRADHSITPVPKVGRQLRFDLSPEGLRERRTSRTEARP